MGRFPFPIPTGWFCVEWSKDLAIGQVKPIRYFAKDLVLFRTADGQAHVLDAHCPHLGAHMGHGGVVKDNTLVCPFHAWGFSGTGECVEIPYTTKKIPPKASLGCWHVCERNAMIMVWHDLAGRAPLWDMPEITEVADPGWTDPRTREWTIRSCNQETAENQVDAAHFRYLHGTTEMPRWESQVNGHHMLTHSTTGMSTPMGQVDGKIEVNAWGFGFTTTRFTGLIETLLLSSASPIDEDHLILRFGFMVRDMGKGLTGGVGKAFMSEIGRQLEQDIPIWENKIYIDPPMLCDGDGPIGKFRKWAKQFYPETTSSVAAPLDEAAAQV